MQRQGEWEGEGIWRKGEGGREMAHGEMRRERRRDGGGSGKDRERGREAKRDRQRQSRERRRELVRVREGNREGVLDRDKEVKILRETLREQGWRERKRWRGK